MSQRPGLTVAQLVEQLLALPQDLPVTWWSDEYWGFGEVAGVAALGCGEPMPEEFASLHKCEANCAMVILDLS